MQSQKYTVSDTDLNHKIKVINDVFASKKGKLWNEGCLMLEKDGIHIQFQSSAPYVHFGDVVAIIKNLKNENIIHPLFQLTIESLNISSDKDFVRFKIPLYYLTDKSLKIFLNDDIVQSYKQKISEESISEIKNTSLLNAEILTQGPLSKKMATKLLEDVINEFSILDARYQFSINNDGLILEFQNSITGTKIHYLNLLFQSADLTQISLNKKFLDLYIQQNHDTFSHINVATMQEIEELYSKRNILPLDSSDEKISQAHRYAIYHYTHSALEHHFNALLRGNITYLKNVAASKDVTSQYFQSLAFYTLSTLLISIDYLTKSLSNTVMDHTAMPSYRIQFHSADEAKTVSIVNAVEQGKNNFMLYEPSLISTSNKQLAFDSKLDVINDKFNGKIVVIRFSEKRDHSIEILSPYQHEMELLLSPSVVHYTVLRKDGPFIFLDAKIVNPLDLEKNNAYILQHALRHVADRVKQEFKDSKSGDCDHSLRRAGYDVIHRPNHGLAHAARQAKLIEDVLEYLIRHGKKNTIELCENLKNETSAVNIIQIAALFLSVGRENEKSGEEDMEGYIKSRAAATKYFEDYINKYYGINTLVANPVLFKIFTYCKNNIQHLGSPVHLRQLGAIYKDSLCENDLQNLIIYHLLTTVHLLETPRCLPLTTGKNILNQRLFDDMGCIIQTNENAKTDLLKLWELSVSRIVAVGDRVIGRNDYELDKFYSASTDPSYLERVLEFAKPKEMICTLDPAINVSENKMEEMRNEAIFHLFYYLFKKCKDPLCIIKFLLGEHKAYYRNAIFKHCNNEEKMSKDPEVSRFIEHILLHGMFSKDTNTSGDPQNKNGSDNAMSVKKT